MKEVGQSKSPLDGGTTDARSPVRKGKGRLKAAAREIEALLASQATAEVKALFAVQELADIATVLEYLPAGVSLEAFRTLPLRDQAETLGHIKPKVAVSLANAMDQSELSGLMGRMSHDERVDLYKALAPKARAAILPGMAQADREDLARLAAWPEGTVGAIMTTDYATLRPEMASPAALDALRRQAIESETVYTAYVIDEEHHLLGDLPLRRLLLARTDETVSDVMRRDPVTVVASADREEAAALIARYDLIALPVLDAEGRMVGIVTQDDAMDIAQQEATEDIYKASTIEEFDGDVREASLFSLYRARIVWLVLLVFGNIFSGAGISFFEDTIAGNLALLFFLPLLIGSGGNAGAQSATLMVRSLATGDVRRSDWAVMFGREILIGLGLGLTMAAAVSIIGVVRAGVDITLVVVLSMTLIVLIGALIGVSLPFLLSKLNLDPATASGPLVTSIADVVGVLIYFTIAAAVLGT